MRLKATKFAEYLNALGIQIEDNITIITVHHDDLLSVLIGASAVGAIINPLDPSFSKRKKEKLSLLTGPQE